MWGALYLYLGEKIALMAVLGCGLWMWVWALGGVVVVSCCWLGGLGLSWLLVAVLVSKSWVLGAKCGLQGAFLVPCSLGLGWRWRWGMCV